MLSKSIGAVAALALVGVAGCGGSSNSGLSRSQLAAKANAICAAANAKGNKIQQPSDLLTNASAAAAYFNAVEPIAAQSTAQLAALKPDSSAKSDWNNYMALRQQGLTLLKTIQSKANAHDRSGIAVLQQSVALQRRVAAAANTLGATTCAQ
jgi:hypothetical protein